MIRNAGMTALVKIVGQVASGRFKFLRKTSYVSSSGLPVAQLLDPHFSPIITDRLPSELADHRSRFGPLIPTFPDPPRGRHELRIVTNSCWMVFRARDAVAAADCSMYLRAGGRAERDAAEGSVSIEHSTADGALLP